MSFIKEELEITDYLSSSYGTISNNSRKRRRSDSGSDSSFDIKSELTSNTSSGRLDGRTGRGIVIKPVDPSSRCLTHASCRRVTNEIRTTINRHFAQLPYAEKRDFISSSVICSLVNTQHSGRYARKHSNEYHLYWTDTMGEFFDFTVCRAMFISTIGITPWTMRNWLGENLALLPNKESGPKQRKSGSGRKSHKVVQEVEIVKLEEQPYKKFKSMLLYRYLQETN